MKYCTQKFAASSREGLRPQLLVLCSREKDLKSSLTRQSCHQSQERAHFQGAGNWNICWEFISTH